MNDYLAFISPVSSNFAIEIKKQKQND